MHWFAVKYNCENLTHQWDLSRMSVAHYLTLFQISEMCWQTFPLMLFFFSILPWKRDPRGIVSTNAKNTRIKFFFYSFLNFCLTHCLFPSNADKKIVCLWNAYVSVYTCTNAHACALAHAETASQDMHFSQGLHLAPNVGGSNVVWHSPHKAATILMK